MDIIVVKIKNITDELSYGPAYFTVVRGWVEVTHGETGECMFGAPIENIEYIYLKVENIPEVK